MMSRAGDGALPGAVGVAAAEPRRGGRKPDFFIVGNPKSGTTALYEMLKRHPQVYMPELKETLYFSRDHPHTPPSAIHPETLEEYLSLFSAAAPEQRAGEASVGYLRSPVAAERIAQVAPQARIIALLREPASFICSMHMELIRDHVETETDLLRAIARDQAANDEQGADSPTVRPRRKYATRYVETVRRYRELFPAGQVLILIYEDFRADNAMTMRKVLSFLEIDEQQSVEALEVHPSVRVRSVGLYGFVRSLYRGEGAVAGPLSALVKTVTPRSFRRRTLDLLRRRVLYAEPEAPDEALMRELRRRYKPEVVALGEYLDRDLVTFWGYDRIS